MRVIVVDQDSTMLEGIVRALRDHFVIDVVSTKAGCIDLLRQNEFDIVVACERLEDGSGLELLGQIAKRWPGTLRVFAAEPARLRLLGVRLGPFGLLRTLAYPVDPWKLYDALSADGAACGADAETAGGRDFVLGDDEPTDPAVPPLVPVVSRPKAAAPQRRPRLVTSPAARKPARRVSWMMAAGSAVTLCVIFIAVTWLHSKPVVKSVPSVRAAPPAHLGRGVDSLVAAVEADFTRGHLEQAQIDLRQLRAMAPANPRLPFFDALLSRGERGSDQRSSHLRKASHRGPTDSDSPSRREPGTVAAQRAAMMSAALAPGASKGNSAAAHTVRVSGPPDLQSSQTDTPPAASPAKLGGQSGTQSTTSPAEPVGQSGTQSATSPAEPAAHAVPALLDPMRKAEMDAGLIAPPVTADAQLVHRISPEYPAAAAQKGLEGSVDVRFTITSRGTVENPAVISADPPNVFDRVAIDAVRRWRYDPRVVDGKPVDSQSRVRLEFKLNASTSQ